MTDGSEGVHTHTSSADRNLFVFALGEMPDYAGKSFTKAGGYSGTDINAMWRIRVLTEAFGPCGLGWYTRTVKRWTEYSEVTGETKVYCDIELYVKDPETGEWSYPITGTGGNDAIVTRKGTPIVNDEMFKMAETDAFGSACKKLGIGWNVYMKADPSKYTMFEDGSVGRFEPTKEDIARQNAERNASRTDGFFGQNARAKAQLKKQQEEQQGPVVEDAPEVFVTGDVLLEDNLDERLVEWSKDPQFSEIVAGFLLGSEVKSVLDLSPADKAKLRDTCISQGATL